MSSKYRYSFLTTQFITLGLTLGLGSIALGASTALTFDLMHTKPNCNYPGRTSTSCELADRDQAEANAGMVKKIQALLDQYALSKVKPGKALPNVYIAYLSFSNQTIQGKLCEVGKAGIPVEVILDNGSLGQGDQVLGCQKDPKNPNVKVSYLGGLTSTPWRLHHNKYLIIDPNDGTPVSTNFSSGNLSSFGTSLHLDHWVMITADKSSNLIRANLCVAQDGMHAAIAKAKETGMYANGQADGQFDQVVADAYISARDACYKAKKVIPMSDSEAAVKAEGIAPLFSPNTNDEVYQTAHREFLKVTAEAKAKRPAYIYIAIQHFLHSGVRRDLIDAANAGVDVRIIMDDDVVLGSSEVQGVKEFYDTYLKPSKIKIRFASTNAAIKQMMHNKFTILNGKRTLSGAGHFTTAAMNNNWENFYLIENAGLMKKYAAYFKELWDVSIDESAVVNGLQTGKAPSTLSPEFLSLLK